MLTSSKHNAKLLPSDTCITYVTACTYPIWYISCIFMWVCLRIRWIRYLKIQQFRIIFHLTGLCMTMWLCWPHLQTHPCDLLSPKGPLHFFTTLQSLHRHRELDLFGWNCCRTAETTEMLTLWCHQTWLAGKSPRNSQCRIVAVKIIYKWGIFYCLSTTVYVILKPARQNGTLSPVQ